MADDACLVNHKGDTSRHDAQRFPHAVARTDRAALIAEQSKGKAVFGREPRVGRRRVITDADDVGPGVREHRVRVPKGTRLGRTAGRIVLGIEIQDDGLLAKQGA